MSVIRDATEALQELAGELRATRDQAALDPNELAERIHRVVLLLSSEDARWVGTTEAKRLLGVGSENTVKAWARLGLLRSRLLPNRRLQVLLDDVLLRRKENQAILALGGEEMSIKELELLAKERPGKRPWEQSSPASSPR